MSIDWNEIEKENNNGTKTYAPEGEYDVKVDEISVVKSAKKGTPGLVFLFTDPDGYTLPQKYPESMAHYCLGDSNRNFRIYHNKDLLVAMGVAEDKAREAIEKCESSTDYLKAYENMYDRLASKHPRTRVVVFKRRSSDQYAYGLDFADTHARMHYTEDTGEQSTSLSQEQTATDGDDLGDLPF